MEEQNGSQDLGEALLVLPRKIESSSLGGSSIENRSFRKENK